jgi:hypothetical protein
MVALTFFKSATLLALVSSLVSAAPTTDGCKDFRITSPHSYFTTTAGQCYQLSYDFGGASPSGWITVDLYEYGTNKFIQNMVTKAPASGISTPWFNVGLGKYKKTGDYYFQVTYGPKCKPIKSTQFHVIYNSNSGPATCPN